MCRGAHRNSDAGAFAAVNPPLDHVGVQLAKRTVSIDGLWTCQLGKVLVPAVLQLFARPIDGRGYGFFRLMFLDLPKSKNESVLTISINHKPITTWFKRIGLHGMCANELSAITTYGP